NGTDFNVIAADLVAGAVAGITLDTKVSTLSAAGGTGSIHVSNTGGVSVTGATPAGAIVIGAKSPLTVSGAITAGGDITLTADGSTGATNDDLTLNAAVTSTGGNITLTADDHVIQNAASSVSAAGPGSVSVTATNASITMAASAATSSGTGTITYAA